MKIKERMLADHYLKSSGVAAIVISPDGKVTACGTIGIDLPPGWVCFGCLAGDIDRLAGLARRCRGDQAEVAAQLGQLAADHFIGLSRHADVVARALHAVALVDDRIREMQSSGGMAAVNRAFKTARAVTPSLRYRDHLDAFKSKLIEQMAAQLA